MILCVVVEEPHVLDSDGHGMFCITAVTTSLYQRRDEKDDVREEGTNDPPHAEYT